MAAISVVRECTLSDVQCLRGEAEKKWQPHLLYGSVHYRTLNIYAVGLNVYGYVVGQKWQPHLLYGSVHYRTLNIYAVGLNVYGYVVGQKWQPRECTLPDARRNGSHIFCRGVYIIGRSVSMRWGRNERQPHLL